MSFRIMKLEKGYLVCEKEAGMLSELSGNAASLPLAASKALAGMGEKETVFTVHRLDKNVGGLSILARTPAVASYFAREIEEHRVEKIYLAVVTGIPEAPEGRMEDLLFRDSAKNKTFVVDRMRKGVRDASLEYRVLQTVRDGEKDLTLVAVKLHTGRTHQIRVQFASRKLPLAGDGRYGSGDGKDLPALFAYKLSFVDPQRKRVTLSCEKPEVYPFTLFEEPADLSF